MLGVRIRVVPRLFTPLTFYKVGGFAFIFPSHKI